MFECCKPGYCKCYDHKGRLMYDDGLCLNIRHAPGEWTILHILTRHLGRIKLYSRGESPVAEGDIDIRNCLAGVIEKFLKTHFKNAYAYPSGRFVHVCIPWKDING